MKVNPECHGGGGWFDSQGARYRLLQAIEKNFHRPENKSSAKQSADCPAIPTLISSR
jgi:hypothetical protein